MAGRYLLESSVIDGYLLEDNSGVLILEELAPIWKVINETEQLSEAGARQKRSQKIINETEQLPETKYKGRGMARIIAHTISIVEGYYPTMVKHICLCCKRVLHI